MENSIITSVGVSGKDSTLESDVGLGLKLQSTESFPFKIMSTHHQYHHRPFPLSSSESVDDGGGGCGPSSNSGANEVLGDRSMSMNHIYHHAPAAAASSGGAVGIGRTLQPFDISTTTTAATTHSIFKSPGGMAATLGFPFTSAQWKELERQAMIYKYMMASVPVPDDLLLPITRNLSAESQSSLGSGSSTFNLRFSSNNKDPEPGRCKRTDGKKWRCSRDVAPQQKYCERHMHRGRPRSRKPVEVHAPFNNSNSNNIITTTTTANKKTRLHHHHPLPTTPTPLTNPTFHTNISSPHLLGSTIQPPLLLDKSTDKEHIRGLDWTTEGELVTMDTSEQQWQHLMQTNIGLTTGGSIYNTAGPIFLGQDYREEPLNLISYTDFGSPEANQQNNDRSLFLNPDLVSLEKESQETPRGFIDAWSNDNANTINSNNNNKYESSVSSECKLSPSSLTLSMAMATGNALDEEMGQIQMGLGVTDSDHNYGVGGTCHKRQVSRWLSPVSWVPSTPGGPLAEVLRPSTVATNGDSICTPATTVSSPTGVLQRTMLSLSDSSCCNSPTLAASKTPPEITAFQWLS